MLAGQSLSVLVVVDLIKSPKRSMETCCFYSISSCYYYSFFFFSFFHFYFFLSKFCLDEFSVTTGRIVQKFGDMVDMDVKLCRRACSKSPKFCLDYFSLTTEGVVLIFMICYKLMYNFVWTFSHLPQNGLFLIFLNDVYCCIDLQESFKFKIKDSGVDPEACIGPTKYLSP